MNEEESLDLEAIKAGDKRAFAALVDAYSPRLYRLALRMLGDPLEAEDVLQDTFIKAFRNLQSFEGRSKMGTWLYLALPQGGGWFRVEDRMHPRWRKRVDVWMGTSRRDALAFGKRRGRVYFITAVSGSSARGGADEQFVHAHFAKEGG